MAAYFEHASKQLLALRRRPAAVLVAGDCAHLKGKAADYEAFVRLTRPIADAGLPMHITLGNHDQRDNFWQAVGTEQADADLGRQAGVVEGRHANWLLLDSLDKTNQGAGELGADQLDWLAAALDAHTDRPAILMLHHNPDHPKRGGSLRDSDALLEIARPRRHVKAICFGHTHVWETARDRSGIHMVNLPATGYTLWLRSFVGWTDWRVDGRGADLTVHAIKHADRDNNQTLRLEWRD